MLRRRHPLLAIPLLAGVLAAAPGEKTTAQTASDPDLGLMRPVFDGNPQDPPRFRRSTNAPRQGNPSRFSQIQNYDYRPALGAGTTGFNSTSASKRKGKAGKAGQPAKPGSATGAGSQRKANVAPKIGLLPKAQPTIDTPPATPAQLQPATAALLPRARDRPGAPPIGPDLVTATIATTPPSRRPPPEENPFDPLGIQVGAFKFRPAFEYTRGYDNNAPRNSTPPTASSSFSIYAPELLINSNWARHELTASLRGSHTTYDTNHPLDRPNLDAKVTGRIDVTRQTRIDLEGRYLLFTDSPGSPNVQADLIKLPIAMTYGSTAGIGHRFNRFEGVFGIALGYEDLNDHDELRHDPMMAVLAGKLEAGREDCAPVAGKSTLNRLELSKLEPTRYHKISHNPVAIKKLPVELFLEAHKRAPQQIILDLDATDDPLHGQQEGRFFRGYYDCYCYLPLYVFCGRHLLVAKLRRADMDAAAGAVEEVARIVAQIRARWPRTRILLRADCGFARDELMAWCEASGVDFLFGLAKNDRLIAEIKSELDLAAAKSRRTGRPERRFKTFMWMTRSYLEPPAPGRGQGRVDPRGSQSSLCRHLADAGRVQGQTSLREGLLRPRRHGESDQGVPARLLCRSHLDRHDAGKSAAPVVLLDGLYPAVRHAPFRTPRHQVRQCHRGRTIAMSRPRRSPTA